MKAVNKVRLIYLPAIVLPIFVMIVSIAGLSIGYSRRQTSQQGLLNDL